MFIPSTRLILARRDLQTAFGFAISDHVNTLAALASADAATSRSAAADLTKLADDLRALSDAIYASISAPVAMAAE